MGFKQGKIKTSNLNYYIGKQEYIVYRSSWELKAFLKLEQLGKLKKIIGWSSEDVVIPYMSDVDSKPHRYFMDLRVQLETGIVLVEIKPLKETYIPSKPRVFKTEAQKRGYEKQLLTCIKNQNKWKYTMQYCARMTEATGQPWTFQIWSERNKSKNQVPPYVREIFDF